MVEQELAELSIEFRKFLLESHPRLSREVINAFYDDDEKTSFQKTLKRFFRLSDNFFLTTAGVKDYIQKLINLIGFDAPLQACLEYATRQVTETANLPKGDLTKLGLFYQYVVLPCMQVRQNKIRDIVNYHPALDKTEKFVMVYGHVLALVFDNLFTKWWKYVVIPYQSGLALNENLKSAVSDRFKNRYAILVSKEGQFIKDALTIEMLDSCMEIPLAQAFPEKIGEIKNLLINLLKEIPDEEETYQKYFAALLNAIGCTNLEEMEKLWIEVDLAWVDIGKDKRVIPSHMIEWGYHHPVQISPEFRIGFRTTFHQEQINLMQQVMMDYALSIDDKDGWKRLKKADAGLFYVVFSGGQGIDFRFAGQSAPNYPEAKLKGLKVLIDFDSLAQRVARFKSLLQQCASEETLSWALPLLDDMDFQMLLILSHEFGHPLLASKKLMEVFGGHRSSIEETKATLLGIFAIKKAIQKGQLGKKVYLQLAAGLLADIIRRFEKDMFNTQTMKPYVNTAMAMVDALSTDEILTTQEAKLHLDKGIVEIGSITDPAGILNEITDRIIKAYKEVDLEAALAILEEYAPGLDKNKYIDAVYQSVNAILHPN